MAKPFQQALQHKEVGWVRQGSPPQQLAVRKPSSAFMASTCAR
jgi:hypothetical protein